MHYHFIGICGVSMSGLAKLLEHKGFTVTGSDLSLGGHGSLPTGVDIVVKSGAIGDDNPEVTEARSLGLPVVDRSLLLAQISREYKNVIAVAGTSGKSTTTAMIGEVFKAAGLDPTVHNGIPNGLTIGGKDFFITEACEFQKSFLTLYPKLGVITNIRPDHINCYEDFDDLKKSFDQFKEQSTNHCIPRKTKIKLKVLGEHNLENAQLALGAALHFGIDEKVAIDALENFNGIHRRFEILVNGVVSDYAHHPDEIKTTIATARMLYKNFLIVFQPHTYSRTVNLFNEFVDVLKSANTVFFKTYSAREDEIIGGRSEDLAEALNQPFFDCEKRLVSFLKKIAHKYEAIIFTGAGDIDAIARSYY